MVAITYVEHNGTRHTVDVEAGSSLMIGATLNMVPGVDGMCGGICSCATCHCYIPDNWRGKLPGAGEGEQAMLEGAGHRKAGSRLGCQVIVTAELDGLEVQLPPEQGVSN
jgi:2Fe-2S ferredoxin